MPDYGQRIAVVETKVEALVKQGDEHSKKLDWIIDSLSQAKGSWRIWTLLFGSGGVLTAVLMKWGGFLANTLPK